MIIQRAIRAVCLFYWAFLTVLLLVPDPLAWLWGLGARLSPPNRGVHFCAFFLLALLCLASRPPSKSAVLAFVLVIYALTAESLQGLVKDRTVELIDYLENLAGLAVGAIVWHFGCRLVRRYKKPDRATSE